MGFTFGFTANDVSDDEFEGSAVPVLADTRTAEVSAAVVASVPKLHDLSDILQTLHNVRISFDTYETPKGNIVYRREFFDIKHQAMTEEDGQSSEVQHILVGLGDQEVDLKTNVYEGGFKLWECSYDLVDKLQQQYASGEFAFESCLELGCGTSLPTCYLLHLLLTNKQTNKKFVLSDFNYEVLRLVTVPNLIIHWASTVDPETLLSLMDPEIPLNSNELLLTPALLASFTSQLNQSDIQISLISGSWGLEFTNLVAPFSPDLILTSETIYSLDTMPILLSVIIELLEKQKSYLALIAAKHYYFGVGGSINDFTQRLSSVKPSTMKVDSIGTGLGQLKRDIVRLQHA